MPSDPPGTPGSISIPPDGIDPEALAQIHLLDEERVERVWKSLLGVLVMTNLRCVELRRRPRLFSKSDWESGPNLFFYNLAPPKVVFHRYLRLSEEHERKAVAVRILLHDPNHVAREIQEARAAGQNEWIRRRARAEASFRLAHQRWRSARRVIVHTPEGELVKVRCHFCGNLMDITVVQCPFCGAPQQ
ncbi:MAG TPA: hypothetical protein VEH57_09680 [Thermoplasmata archaeon]|nr:hypothetical protein [Thermoplasmata archaeon]